MSDLTPYQMLRQYNQAVPWGYALRLRPYEKVLSVTITDTAITCMIETFQVTEQVRRTVFHNRGERMIAWQVTDQGRKRVIDTIIWDDDSPADVQHSGRDNEVSVYNERRRWELDCYRPGTDVTELDNVQSSDYSPRMQKHWGLATTTTPATN